MNTAVILFKGGNPYIQNKQLKQVLKEEREQRGILCENYDELEELMTILNENKIPNVIILHENKNLDNFISIIDNEYGQLFEKIEVIVDYSKERFNMTDQPYYRAHLLEADNRGTGTHKMGGADNINTARSRGHTTDSKQVGSAERGQITQVILYPNNPLVKDVFGQLPTGMDSRTTAIANIVTLDYINDGFWSINAFEHSKFIGSLKDSQKLFTHSVGARSYNGLVGLFPSLQKVYGPPTLIQKIGVPQQNTDITINNTYNKIPDRSAATAALKFGLSILKELQTVKIDKEKVSEFLKEDKSKKSAKISFLQKTLAEIQFVEEKVKPNKDFAADTNIIDNALKRLGVYKDLEDLSRMADEGGLGIAKTLAGAAIDTVKQVKDKYSKKDDSEDKEEIDENLSKLVSCSNWNNYYNAFQKEEGFSGET